ncbi:MAG: DUF58 domain-containing protein [Dermatophilaceae bacterium]|nr:DUF58 domain-containing protein [Dermatophilaceae bacterium]
MTRIRDILTTRGHAFVAAGLTLLVGGLLLGFTDITRVGVLLAALPLLSALNARRGNSSVEVTRTVHPARLVVDQGARVVVVLQNTSDRHTQLLLAEESVHLLLGDRPRFVLPSMVPGDIREVDYPIRSQVRGRFRLGPMTLRRQDPYGLATITTTLPGSIEILVLPRVEVLGNGRPRAGGLGTEGAIPHMVALHGEDDVAVRTYRDGDDLRRIHWPATAHRSELMVRQEDRPARRRAVIVLDSRTSGHQGSGSLGSFEWSVTAAASVAAHLFDHRYALHLVSSEAITEGTAAQTVEIDDALACLAMAQPGTLQQFDEVLHWAHPLTSAGGLVVAIATDHDESVLRRIAALRQPEGNGLLLLLDSATFGPARAEAPAGRASALAGLVAGAGWSTCVVTSGMSVAAAWNAVSARSPVTFGAGR